MGSAPASGAVSGAPAGNLARTTTDSRLSNESSLTPARSSAGARTTAREARALPDSFFHGKTGGHLVVSGPLNLPVGRLFVEEVIKKHLNLEAYDRRIIIHWSDSTEAKSLAQLGRDFLRQISPACTGTNGIFPLCRCPHHGEISDDS